MKDGDILHFNFNGAENEKRSTLVPHSGVTGEKSSEKEGEPRLIVNKMAKLAWLQYTRAKSIIYKHCQILNL